MKKVLLATILIIIPLLVIRYNFCIIDRPEESVSKEDKCKEISGTIEKGETLFDIFKKYELDIRELFKLKEASADVHKLRRLYPGRPYKISIDMNNHVDSFIYWINDDFILNIRRTESGFSAEKLTVEYEKRVCHIGGLVKDNLISSIGEDRENVMLALQLSDIFVWDIDFTTDMRNDDTFRIIVEGFYLNGEFKKYGEILSAEFVNDGETYRAYRYERDGKSDYYDADGKSLKRSFLKAPLNFRRISSTFSHRRFHPILRIYRPHLGVDYAASAGTPVSVVGDGTVVFAGYKGQNGKIVIIRHYNGYRTYYGHLSKIVKGIKRGAEVRQGQILGYVGATGLATGPHLDYRIQVNMRFVNPLTLKVPRGESIPNKLITQFKSVRDRMDTGLASITLPVPSLTAKRQE